MTYPAVLPRPPYLTDYHGSIHVRIRYDNRDLCLQQACGPIELPEDLPVAPLVTLEARTSGGKVLFPVQVWDYEGDRGRGGWAIYDESLFSVPESTVESEPEVEPSLPVEDPEPEVETETAVRPSEDLDDLDDAAEDLDDVVDEDEDVEEDD